MPFEEEKPNGIRHVGFYFSFKKGNDIFSERTSLTEKYKKKCFLCMYTKKKYIFLYLLHNTQL